MSNDDLAQRLTEVEDRLALIELEGAYARAFDSRDGDAWAALFTPDGIYQARGATPEAGNFVEGHDELARFCTNAPFDGIHLLHLPQLTISGDTATSRVHLQFIGEFHSGTRGMRMIGYYDVRYRRTDAGWRIAHRVTSTMFGTTSSNDPYPVGDGFTDPASPS